MDIWDQVPPCASWNDQIDRSIDAEIAACPNRQAVFLYAAVSRAQAYHTGKSQMKNYLRNHGFTDLLPSEERKGTDPVTEDQITKQYKAA